MQALRFALVPLALVAMAPAQQRSEAPAASRPTSADGAAAKKREGGFHGITFRECLHDGRPALEVRAVLAGSDAERLGFRAGDLILGVDGERLRNGDHFIQMLYRTVPELRAKMGGGGKPRGRGPSSIAVLRSGQRIDLAGGLADLDATPRVGDPAPDFTLSDPSGKHEVTLAKLLGKKPVVLVFGSLT